MREIITRWSVQNASSDILSIMYFNEAGATVADQRAALGRFWGTVDANLQNTTTWTVETEGRELDLITGALTGAWTETTPQTGTGAASTGSAVANGTQVLLRWNTGQIVNGRFLKGRTFVPGLASGALSAGELGNGIALAIEAAMGIFIGEDVGFMVWHRPKGGSGGNAEPVASGSVWRELAVQRRRRA